MVDLILQILEVDEFRGKSKNIDIAKGSNKIPMSFKEAWQQFKRIRAWQ